MALGKNTVFLPALLALKSSLPQISARGGHCSFKSAGSTDFIGFAARSAAATVRATEDSPEQARAITRIWQRFRAGQ